MILRFEITMPNNGSWNGVDTGNKGGHYIFQDVPKKQADVLNGTSHYYNFGDGWGANVSVSKARKSKSNGFRGYDWMVKELLHFGKILEKQERDEMRKENKYPFHN